MLSTPAQRMFAELEGLDELALIGWFKLPQDYKSATSKCLPKGPKLDPFPFLQFSHLGMHLPFPEENGTPQLDLENKEYNKALVIRCHYATRAN